MDVSISGSDGAAAYLAKDPGWREAWWWLLIPVAAAVGIWTIHELAPDFYAQYMLPEHTGYLERSHFLLPLAASIMCLRILWKHNLSGWPLLRLAVIVFAVTCLYIALEEESYGQHFFQWQTPEKWSAINRQNETNLHNTSYYFNQLPQVLLYTAILVGGIALPIGQALFGRIPVPILQILIPPAAILPVSLVAAGYKSLDRLENKGVEMMPKPSEVTETFFVMFILFFVIMLHRRTRSL
jgi:hypothetical protein